MYNQWQHIGQRPQGVAQVPQYQMAQQQQYWQYYSQMQGQQTVAQGTAPLFQPPPPIGPPPPTDEPKPPLPGLDPAPPVEPPNDEKPPLPPEPPPTDTKGKINDVEQQKMTELQKQAADWQEQQRQWAEYQQNLSTYHQQLQQWQQTHGEQMATSSANQFPPTSQPPPATLPQSQPSSLSQPPPTNTVSSAILQPTATAIQETIEDVEREEKEFQNQYADWMKQYTDWKEQNKDHPNRDLYNQYEQQWKQYEGQMEEKRRVLNERKQRASQAKQIASQQSITFPIQGQTVNSQSQFGGPQQIRPGVPQGQNFTVPPPRHDGPPSRFGGPPSQRFDGPHGLQSETSDGGVRRFDAPGGSRFERPQGQRFEVPGSSSMQHPSGNRFEGPGGNRFAGPSGNRFEGPGGNRFEAPGGKRFEVPGGNRFEGPGGKRFEAPIRNRFEGPGEKKFERPSGNRFEGPGGNRFEGPGGNRFEGPGGNRFEGPGGNRFDGTGGQKFEGPSGNRFEGPGGNRFPGPGGNRFDSPGLKRLEVPSGNRFEGPGGYIPGPNGGPFRGARRGISETRHGGHFGPPPGMDRGGLTGSQFGKANFDEPEQAFDEGAGDETRYEEEGQMFNEQGQPLEESDKQFDEENVEEASQHDSMSEVNQEGEQLLGMDEENFDDGNQEEGYGVPPMHAGGMRSRFSHPGQHMRGDRGAPFDGPRGFDGPQRFNNPQQMNEMSGFPGQMRFRGPRPFRGHERFGDPGQFSMRGNRGRPPFVPQGRGRGQQQGGPISLMDVRFEKPQGLVEEGIESGEFEGTDQMVFEEEVQDFTQDIDAQFPPRGRGGWGRGRPMRGRGRGRGMDHFAPEEDFGQDEGWSQGQGEFGMRARGRGIRGRDGRGRGGWSGGHHEAPYHEEEVEAEGLEQDGTGPLNPQLQPPHLRLQANESQKESTEADAANQLFSDREHALIIKAAEELKALRDQLEQESKGSDDKPKEGDDSQPLVPYDDEEESREEGDFQRQARNMGRGGPGRFPPPEHHDPEDVLQMIDQRLGGGFPMRREIYRGGPQRGHGGFPRDFLDADDLGMGGGRGRGLPPRRGLPQRGRDELSHLALLGRSRDPLEVLLEQRLGRRPRSSLEDHLLRDLLPPVDPLSDPLLEERYRLERRRLLDPLLDPLRESGLGGDIMRDLRFQPRLPMERRFSPTPQAFTRTAPPPPLAQPPQVIDYGHGQGTSTTSEDSEKVKDIRAEKDLPAAYRDEMDSRHHERSRERSRSRERDVDYRERDGRDRYDRDRYRSDHRSRARSRDRDRYDRDRDRPREHRERSGIEPQRTNENRRSGIEPQRTNENKRSGIDPQRTNENKRRDDFDFRAVYGACPVEKKAETLTVEDLLCNPGRRARPERIVIIVRGPPGAGKTYASKLLKEKEMSNGGTAPRMLCLDDYFMVDKEKTVKDPDTGKEVTKTVLEYEFDAKMEESYIRSFFKSYKRQIDESYFSFIIVDAVFDDKAYLEQFWSYGKHKGFQVYVAEVMADANVCEKRNKHDRTLKDIKKIIDGWQGPPPHYIRLDLRSLLQDAAIEDVEMEDQADESTGDGKNSSKEKEEEEEEEEETQGFTKSKWELDVSEDKLERLDGIRKRRKSESDPKDLGEYLQLTDDYDSRTSEPGKKRVRWADIEERKSQDKMRKIGFVVGRTNWDKMTDDEYANKALNRTKYI